MNYNESPFFHFAITLRSAWPIGLLPLEHLRYLIPPWEKVTFKIGSPLNIGKVPSNKLSAFSPRSNN